MTAATLSRAGVALIASALALLMGCSTVAPVNPPMNQVDPNSGYRLENLVRPVSGRHNDPDTIVMLAFSGGGMRAAAFAYGVLEELRRTGYTAEGQTHSLLEQVDLVTGVSGGSFTALAFALLGDQLFEEFVPKFLARNVQAELIGRFLTPTQWPALIGNTYGRSELAADYYDEILFGGATFGDLIKRPGPMVVVSGTDVSTGARFEFSQQYFDLICSDLAQVKLSRAAAASAAVPVIFSPVTFLNHAGACPKTSPLWVEQVGTDQRANRVAGRALQRLRARLELQDRSAKPYLHVVDGGISDNLGVRGMIEGLDMLASNPDARQGSSFAHVRHIVVLVVNARSAQATDWGRSPVPPGAIAQLLQSSSVPVDNYSYESVELLKDFARRLRIEGRLRLAESRLAGKSPDETQAMNQPLIFDAVDISFDAIADYEQRAYAMNLPTSLALPREAVDRLRQFGADLLRQSPAFQDLLARVQLEHGTRIQRLDSDLKASAP